MTQLAFDFDELLGAEFDGLEVVERYGRPHHILREGKKIVGYVPVGLVYDKLPCGVHDANPNGRYKCAEECFGFVCPTCGEQAFNAFTYTVNHDVYGEPGDCVSRALKVRHAWVNWGHLLEHENPDADPSPFTNCWVPSHGHKDSYARAGWPVSCVAASLVRDYEHCLRMGVEVANLPPIDLHKLKETYALALAGGKEANE